MDNKGGGLANSLIASKFMDHHNSSDLSKVIWVLCNRWTYDDLIGFCGWTDSALVHVLINS